MMEAHLPWQNSQKSLLQGAYIKQRMAHAYLLKGPKGLGKYHFSRAMAAWLLCTHRQNGRHCGQCHGCHLMRAGSHPDYVEIVSNSATGGIKIDQIRQGIEFASKTAQQGGFRILVIDPADRMNIYAANALLKLLEEPGAETLLMLISANTQALLPTLRSRCHIVTFHKPEQSQALTWLSEQSIGQHDSERRILLEMAMGSPLLAKQYADTDQLGQRSHLMEQLGYITKGQQSPIAIASTYGSDSALSVIQWMLQWIDDLVHYVATEDENTLKQADIKPMLKYIASKTSLQGLFVYYDWLLAQRRILKERVGVNGMLMLDETFTRWLHLTL